MPLMKILANISKIFNLSLSYEILTFWRHIPSAFKTISFLTNPLIFLSLIIFKFDSLSNWTGSHYNYLRSIPINSDIQ